MKRGGLLTLTSSGLYCKQGDFYIDPWKPVKKAVVTHAHADHAYRGHQRYLVPKAGEQLSRIRLDDDAIIATQDYGYLTTNKAVTEIYHPSRHDPRPSPSRAEPQD